ncbi:MAG: PAS domain S-box protein [Candidatus Bathyarchaeia archaeon]
MLNFHKNLGNPNHSLRDSKLFSRELKSAPYGIILVDIYGKIMFWNKAAERIFGYTAREIVGEFITKIMPKGFKFTVKEEKGITKSTTFHKTFETVGIRKDSSKFLLEFSYTLLNTKQGTFLAVIVRDITRQKEKEKEFKKQMGSLKGLLALTSEELKQAQAKLLQSERMAAIGEPAGMVARDLRNPLMGIAGAVYYLKTYTHSKLDARAKLGLFTTLRSWRNNGENIFNCIESSAVKTERFNAYRILYER